MELVQHYAHAIVTNMEVVASDLTAHVQSIRLRAESKSNMECTVREKTSVENASQACCRMLAHGIQHSGSCLGTLSLRGCRH